MHLDPWTFALQIVNVLVLVWILARFLFRPIAAIIAARRAAADALLAQAEATLTKAASDAATLQHQRDGFAQDAARIIAEARAAAEAEHATLMHQAADAAARLQSDAAKAIDRDRDAMRAALEHEATELAVAIARRLLENVSPQALTAAFLDTLARMLATHPARALLVHEALQLRSAIPLDAAGQTRCRELLANALHTEPQLTFATDPNLLAGIDLIAPHAEIRLSWRADLDRLSQLLLANHNHDTAAQRVA
ncbi:MAG TPA: hypothetical protein VGG99_00820 [Acetobacteraceae bacterium]|jgi:F-type H+-transporting ATPase subunit b